MTCECNDSVTSHDLMCTTVVALCVCVSLLDFIFCPSTVEGCKLIFLLSIYCRATSVKSTCFLYIIWKQHLKEVKHALGLMRGPRCECEIEICPAMDWWPFQDLFPAFALSGLETQHDTTTPVSIVCGLVHSDLQLTLTRIKTSTAKSGWVGRSSSLKQRSSVSRILIPKWRKSYVSVLNRYIFL